MEWLTQLIPSQLMQWLKIYIVPFFQLQWQVMVRSLLLGVTDTILFVTLPLGLTLGSQAIWNARYHLTIAQQRQIERWANAARLIAYIEDVPPVVPLVLWYKESGLLAENPANCEGIMGLHTAVTSGELPCFPPGPVDPSVIIYQLQFGARTFKQYCPEITYTTINPALIKQCYHRYNAGAAVQSNPHDAAYVMNGYDAQHQDMVHRDVYGKEYRLTALGAWPTHLTIQAQLAQREAPIAPTMFLAPALLIQEVLDRVWIMQAERRVESDIVLAPIPEGFPRTCRDPVVRDCFIEPRADGDNMLRPTGSPLLIPPTESKALACGLLPGVDLFPPQPSIVLAPVSGYMTRYVDGRGHLAIQIENTEWTVWITGLRSYNAPAGDITLGAALGAIGGIGSHTPSIHYAVFDRTKAGFVDALSFVPIKQCPPLQ